MQNALHCLSEQSKDLIFCWKSCVKSLRRYVCRDISLLFLLPNALIKVKFLKVVDINSRVMFNRHLF